MLAKPVIPANHNELNNMLNGGYSIPSITTVASGPRDGKQKWLLETAFEFSKNEISTLFFNASSSFQEDIEFLVYIYGEEQMLRDQNNYLHFAEKYYPTISQLESVLIYNKVNNGIKAAFIDTLNYVRLPDGSKAEGKKDFLLLNKALQDISSDLKIAILVGRTRIANRYGEANTPLEKDDLPEHSKYSDNIIALYRDEDLRHLPKEQAIQEVFLLQSKPGKVGKYQIPYQFHAEQENN